MAVNAIIAARGFIWGDKHTADVGKSP